MANLKLKEGIDLNPTVSSTATSANQGLNSAPQPGMILPFAGPVSKIPSGWVLCDGNNGTPNLIGVYPAGHPNIAAGTFFGSNSGHTHSSTFNFSTYAASTNSHYHTTPITNGTTNYTNHGHNHNGARSGGIGNDNNANYRTNGTLTSNITDNNHNHANNNIGVNNSSSAAGHYHNGNYSVDYGSASHAHQVTYSGTTYTVYNNTNASLDFSGTIASGTSSSIQYPTFYLFFIMKVA